MGDESRRYRKRKRAEQERQTRERITEAVVELHRTVGPARTKITEVAERAGVSRVTVYNHFPSEKELIAACSAHWAAANPFPDPAGWTAEVGAARLRQALTELYAFYSGTEDMLGNVIRDAAIVEPLGEVMEQNWEPYMEAVVGRLVAGFPESTRRAEALAAALTVAVDFRTWRRLVEEIPDPGERVDLAVRMIEGVVRDC